MKNKNLGIIIFIVSVVFILNSHKFGRTFMFDIFVGKMSMGT